MSMKVPVIVFQTSLVAEPDFEHTPTLQFFQRKHEHRKLGKNTGAKRQVSADECWLFLVFIFPFLDGTLSLSSFSSTASVLFFPGTC